jgi:hypothetical protein
MLRKTRASHVGDFRMNSKHLVFCSMAVVSLAWTHAATAQEQAAPAAVSAASSMPYPSMVGPLAANPHPATFDAGPLGPLTIDGVVSGLALWQTNSSFDAFGHRNSDSIGDLGNAQIIVNKSDGLVQFYLQAGAYSIPVLGTPYYRADRYDDHTYGVVPQGFIKIVPNSNFNVMVGALPTLVGAEYTFTFENMNIQRGLLWNQEPAVSRGVQVNLTHGPWAGSVALTDGYYSDHYSTLSGSLTYTFPNADTLTVVGSGNTDTVDRATFATPVQQNNGQVYNLIYSHTQGPLTITPYIQYNSSRSIPSVGSLSGSAWGAAVLARYAFTPEFSLAGRVEYIKGDGDANLLGYGTRSAAWSVTLTPTYQRGIFFVRGEVSYVGVTSGASGLMFGENGRDNSQARVVAEAGLIF